MTRGCVWKCEFCAVRTFEPRYVPYVDIKDTMCKVAETSGEKLNLVLMDNNVLASAKFDQIIDDIKELGFYNGATFGPGRGKKRRVDFNQGLDARFLTETKMMRLSEIPLEPMRIAFDSIDLKDEYVTAVRLAHKYGQTNMSNYILYNFDDTPEDFYERLKVNIDLNKEFRRDTGARTTIYSFPMRYIPLNAKTRSVDTGNIHWNRRYLRSLQVILNVMRGSVMPGKDFFEQAFGRDDEEFKAILLMPEEFILNRLVKGWKNIGVYEERFMPYVADWMTAYFKLTAEERRCLVEVLSPDDKVAIEKSLGNIKSVVVRELLRYHLEEEAIVAVH